METTATLDVNYMTEINAMYRYFMSKSPGKAAVAMLQALYMACNAEFWSEWFEVDSECLSRLMGGYSRQAIDEARDKLCRMGRIEYRPGERNVRPPAYKIIPFAKGKRRHKDYAGTAPGDVMRGSNNGVMRGATDDVMHATNGEVVHATNNDVIITGGQEKYTAVQADTDFAGADPSGDRGRPPLRAAEIDMKGDMKLDMKGDMNPDASLLYIKQNLNETRAGRASPLSAIKNGARIPWKKEYLKEQECIFAKAPHKKKRAPVCNPFFELLALKGLEAP